MDVKRIVKIIVPALIGIAIALIAPPEGLTVPAMQFMGIFLCSLIWMVLGCIPDHVIVVIAMTLCVFTGICTVNEAFAPFAGSTMWLLVGAFGISAAINGCGLLKRISLWILKLFPESYMGSVIAMYATGTVISPLIPSLAAKCAMFAPFTVGMSKALGYKKDSVQAGGMFAAMFVPCSIFGMAFFSGAVPVFTVLGFLSDAEKGAWNWFSWLQATFVWFIVVAVLCFVAILLIYKPKGQSESAPMKKGFAKEQLAELGPMSSQEKIGGTILILALVGWMTTSITGFDSGMIAVAALIFMTLFGVFSGPDWKNKIPWTSFIFIGGVFSLAALISSLGISAWMAELLAPVLAPVISNAWLLIPVVVLVTYALRIVVISQTATITIIFTIFGGLCAAAGISAWPILFSCYVSTLVWYYAANNTTYATALAATDGELVSFKTTLPMNFGFMACNLVACTASVPLWMLLGLL